MGVKDFFKIEHKGKTISSLGVQIDMTKSWKIAVDASIEIYRATLALKGTLSYKGKSTAHLKVLFRKIIKFRNLGWKQHWVFDNSVPDPMKAEEVKRRRAINKEREHKITHEMFDQIKTLLKLMGIGYSIAPPKVDAEHFCASLFKAGLCDAVLTHDSDALIYGADIIRTEKIGSQTKYILYRRETILKEFGLKNGDLPKIAAIMGSDFDVPKTRGVGKKTVIANLNKIKLTAGQKLVVAKYLEKVPLDSVALVQSGGKPDIEKLTQFLLEYGFDHQQIKGSMEKFK